MNIFTLKTDSTGRSEGRAATCRCVVSSVKKCVNVCCWAVSALSQQLQAESACQERPQLHIMLRIARGDSDLPVSSLKLATAALSPIIPSIHQATGYQVSNLENKEVGKKTKLGFAFPSNT